MNTENGFRTILTDVTDRKRAEEALRKSEERFRALATSSNFAIYVMSPDWKEVRHVEYRDFITDETFRSELWIEQLIHPDDRPSVLSAVDKAARERTVLRLEHRTKCLDGTWVWTQSKAVPIFDDCGKLVEWFGTAEDISDRKRLEEEINRSNAELQQFASIASHDLQEPLRMVSSYLTLLEKKSRECLDERSLEYLGHAVDGATRMQEMIRDMLSYSRIGTSADNLRPVPMEEPLGMAMKNLSMEIREKGAQVTHGVLPTVNADLNQMVQLFQNLIGNGIKYHGSEPPTVHVDAVRQGRNWLFSVRDNGIGIPKEQIGRLFQMFVRLHTHEEYNGTGIGLALAKRIVERHGGHIWVESEVGHGSTFFFDLPAD